MKNEIEVFSFFIPWKMGCGVAGNIPVNEVLSEKSSETRSDGIIFYNDLKEFHDKRYNTLEHSPDLCIFVNKTSLPVRVNVILTKFSSSTITGNELEFIVLPGERKQMNINVTEISIITYVQGWRIVYEPFHVIMEMMGPLSRPDTVVAIRSNLAISLYTERYYNNRRIVLNSYMHDGRGSEFLLEETH
jgi:hypothetical protein